MYTATDLELVVDLQVLVGTAFSQDVLQRCCTSGVRDVVIKREGEGEVRLSIGFNVDVFFHTASDRVLVDRVDKLWVIFVRERSLRAVGRTHIQLDLVESDAEVVGVIHSVRP